MSHLYDRIDGPCNGAWCPTLVSDWVSPRHVFFCLRGGERERVALTELNDILVLYVAASDYV
jgi:hypothetical protein